MRKHVNYIAVASTSLLILLSSSSFALPNCPTPPDSQFKTVYNLFGSAVTGSQTLLAKSSCNSLKINSGDRYVLVAKTDRFRIYDEDSFFGRKPVAVLEISVPNEGDYVTKRYLRRRDDYEQ